MNEQVAGSERAEGETEASRTRREARAQLVIACAIAHGEGTGLPTTALIELVLEKGLPSREERERMRAERLGDDTAASSTPSG